MKSTSFIFLVLLISFNHAIAQPVDKAIWKAGKSIYHNVFDASKAYFETTESPAIFRGAPAVILAQKYYFTFESHSQESYANSYTYFHGYTHKNTQIIRRRIKIQEKAAIQDFSELYFLDSKYFGAKLIKPDGSEQLIDGHNAVEVKTEIPDFYRGIYEGGTYYKMAIPNLEVGDILDYFMLSDDSASEMPSTSFVTTLADIYPIVKQQYMIDIPPNWSFFINSLNGAPDVESKVQRGANARGKMNRSIKRYVLNDKNRAALTGERWAFRYTTEPTIKVQAFSVITELGLVAFARKMAILPIL